MNNSQFLETVSTLLDAGFMLLEHRYWRLDDVTLHLLHCYINILVCDFSESRQNCLNAAKNFHVVDTG
jgi:hypothetical protein